MPATPKKGRGLGGNAAHQRLMMANLAASLFAAEGIVTTEAKAKALRPVAEKVVTKAIKAANDPDQRLLMANLVASLVAAEAIVTTEAKAKAVRPIAEKMITKAKKGGLHNHRQVVAFIGDKEMASKLFNEIGPRYAERPGGYTRILKLGPRQGDKAPMARIELV